MAFKRLFLDIEVSPNEGHFWQPGPKVRLSYHNITKERAIICVCYKWADEKAVKFVAWEKGEDKALLKALAPVLEQADEVVTHNGDRFDLPWIRTRALLHGVRLNDGFASADTLKVARHKYKFNSNRLDYLGRFLGLGTKLQNPPDLWTRVMDGEKKALADMVAYCKQDVLLLEAVHGKLMHFSKPHSHVGVHTGGDRLSCPYCGSMNTKVNQSRVTPSGIQRRQIKCKACDHFFTVADGTYKAVLKAREMLATKEAKLLADLAALRGGLSENRKR